MKIAGVALRLPCGRLVAAYEPARHGDLYRMLALEGTGARGATQGFITDMGAFVDRHVAFGVAERAGQIRPETEARIVHGVLFSENLW